MSKVDWQSFGTALGECHFENPKPAYINRHKDIDLFNLVVVWPLTKTTDFCSGFVEINEQVEEPVHKSLLSKIFNS